MVTQGATRLPDEAQAGKAASQAASSIEPTAAPSTLHLPATPAEPDPAWLEVARRFHRLGSAAWPEGEAVSAPGWSWESASPAALIPLQELRPGLPAVLPAIEEAGPAAVRALDGILDDALGAVRATGRPAKVLGEVLDRLVRRISRRVRDLRTLVNLREVAGEEARRLVDALALTGDAGHDFAKDVEKLLAALPAGYRVIGPSAPAEIVAIEAARLAREPARRRLLEEARALLEKVDDLLRLDAAKGDSPELQRALRGGLGPLGARLVDASALARLHPDRKARRLDGARRERLERTSRVLGGWIERSKTSPLPAHIIAGVKAVDQVKEQAAGIEATSHERPLSAAADLFLKVAAPVVDLGRALRIARLEIADAYRPEVHDDAIESLDWQALKLDELSAIPLVVARAGALGQRAADIGELGHLVWSGRPVMAVASGSWPDESELADLSRHQPALGSLLVSLRHAWVLQSSSARPLHLAGALLESDPSRPGVVLAAQASKALWAEASVAGRGWPLFRFQVTAGGGEVFDLAGNPESDSDWPSFTLDVESPRGPDSIDLRLTFADAAAVARGGRENLLALPPKAWHDDQLPLAEWLRHAGRDSADGPLPFVWLVDGGGVLWRAVVSRALALAAGDRSRAFEQLRELAGVGGPRIERARMDARGEALREIEEERAKLLADKEAAVAEALREGARGAMSGLAAALLDRDGGFVAAPRAASPEAATAAASPATTEAPEEEPEADKGPPEDADELLEEPWIDTPLCTSCNDCFKVNELLFEYDGNKQAVLRDLSKGTYAELVRAAEICPAKCIHPGRPNPDDPTATPEMIQRGSKL